MINVKVGKLPGRLVDVVLNHGADVGAALAAAGLDSAGYEIRVGTATKQASDAVTDGDTVLLVKMIKGNSGVNVKVGKLPGRLVDVALLAGATVGDALTAAGLDSAGYEIRVGTATKQASDAVTDGDTVLLVKMIKGN